MTLSQLRGVAIDEFAPPDLHLEPFDGDLSLPMFRPWN